MISFSCLAVQYIFFIFKHFFPPQNAFFLRLLFSQTCFCSQTLTLGWFYFILFYIKLPCAQCFKNKYKNILYKWNTLWNQQAIHKEKMILCIKWVWEKCRCGKLLNMNFHHFIFRLTTSTYRHMFSLSPRKNFHILIVVRIPASDIEGNRLKLLCVFVLFMQSAIRKVHCSSWGVDKKTCFLLSNIVSQAQVMYHLVATRQRMDIVYFLPIFKFYNLMDMIQKKGC